jgi:hypothetical protein
MKHVLLINGSSKGRKATSLTLLKYIDNMFTKVITEVVSITDFRESYMSYLIEKAALSTDIIVSFPLYIDSIPAILQNFMEEFAEYRKTNISSNNINLYAVVNCGSPEEMQTEVALKIMMCFAEKSGLTWKYGIGIGMGCLVNPEVFIPEHMFVKNVYEELEKIPDIIDGKITPENNYSLICPQLGFISGKMAQKFYILKVHSIWDKRAEKNKTSNSLDFKPYSVNPA